jgi:hypothetical protein
MLYLNEMGITDNVCFEDGTYKYIDSLTFCS